MHMRTTPLDLDLRRPFRIARGVLYQARNLQVEISEGNLSGIGEAGPDSTGYYGETQTTMQAALEVFAGALGKDPLLMEDIVAELDRTLYHGNTAAKSAVDMALYDLCGKILGVPVYRLLGLNPAQAPVTSFTISIDSPEEMARQAAAASLQYGVLKIKVGTAADVEMVRAIREVTAATLRVDANAAWDPKEAVRAVEALAPYGIELVEQPVAAHDLDGLRLVRERSPIPIFADESCVTPEDVPRLAGCVDGINIKLAKCGGLRNALKMIHVARAHHLEVMLGCMVSSSLAITAAAHLAPLVDFADLDGALLLADDPFQGVRFEKGRIILPDTPGLGVVPRAQGSDPAATRHAPVELID
jgi:L-alanine-DL-glutamate epimerase-like enolase superfamily enzyme